MFGPGLTVGPFSFGRPLRVQRISDVILALRSGKRRKAASRPAWMAFIRAVKSAVAAANNAYDSVQKASKQAAEVAEANFTAMTNTAVKATQTATRGKKAA